MFRILSIARYSGTTVYICVAVGDMQSALGNSISMRTMRTDGRTDHPNIWVRLGGPRARAPFCWPSLLMHRAKESWKISRYIGITKLLCKRKANSKEMLHITMRCTYNTKCLLLGVSFDTTDCGHIEHGGAVTTVRALGVLCRAVKVDAMDSVSHKNQASLLVKTIPEKMGSNHRIQGRRKRPPQEYTTYFTRGNPIVV